jgi:hypothetical protein
MTTYCVVDCHARQQTICYCDSAGGEARLAGPDPERDAQGRAVKPPGRRENNDLVWRKVK